MSYPLHRTLLTSLAFAALVTTAACPAATPGTGGEGGTTEPGGAQPGANQPNGNVQTGTDGLSPGAEPNGVATTPNVAAGGALPTSPNAVANPNLAGAANALLNPNAPLPNGNDVAITKVAAITNPNIGFDDFAVNGERKVVALTFDDGPDGAQGATDMVLDTLKKENLKATFFLCANVGFADLETDAKAQAQLRRIVAEGHQVANHTYDHKDLATLTNEEAAQKLQRLADIYKKVLGPTAPVMTLVRTPFGSPFQLDNPNTQRLASTVTKFGVQVGWGMDPKDWTFDHYSKDPKVFNADVQSVINAVQQHINNKQGGIILLHDVHLPSATALPTVINMFRAAGYKFVSVEDVIRARYGANSASIMAANKAAGLAN